MVFYRNALPPCVVGDDAEGTAVLTQTHHPWMALVKMCTTVDAIGGCVDVPEADGAAVATQRTRHLARAIEVGILGDVDGCYAMTAVRSELRAHSPTVRQLSGRGRLQHEDGRRLMIGCNIASRIEHSDAVGRDESGLCLRHEGEAQTAEGNDETIVHSSNVLRTFKSRGATFKVYRTKTFTTLPSAWRTMLMPRLSCCWRTPLTE